MKVSGPMMSMAASGTIGGLVTASIWKGRPYFRLRVTPSNPKSAGQTATRSMFKFLTQQWAPNVDAADQATWEELAAAQNITTFNAYLKTNMREWTQFTTPTMAYPAAAAGTPGTLATPTAVVGVRQVTITSAMTNVEDNWGMIVHRGTADNFTATKNTVVGIAEAMGNGDIVYVDTPVAAGTYWYRVQAFTVDGVKDAATGDVQAIVT